MKTIFISIFVWMGALSGYFDPNEPVDVVIPSIEKDLETLDLAINGIRENGVNIRRIIVVSASRLTDQAEWFDEAAFPFSKRDVADELTRKKGVDPTAYLSRGHVGWYYQQLLKLYSPLVIPGLSSNVLVLDSDTIFINPVSFVNEQGGGRYAIRDYIHLHFPPHAKRFYPPYRTVFSGVSGVAHHMLFQREPLTLLFSFIENYHKLPLWKAFCRAVSKDQLECAGASEYEIYFNFVFSTYPEMEVRPLCWVEIPSWKERMRYKEEGYDFITCHTWLR